MSEATAAARGTGVRPGALLARAAAMAVALACLAGAPARAAAPLHWSPPQPVDSPGSLASISCSSEALCVGVDSAGNALSSPDPTSAAATWTLARIDAGHELRSVSCTSGLCVAVDASGDVLSSSAPLDGAPAWSAPLQIDTNALDAVSCASQSLCAAVDEAGQVRVSVDPGSPAPSWRTVYAGEAVALRAVSCAESVCAAVDGEGDVLASSDPPQAGSWHLHAIDPALSLAAISCASAQQCVAVDEAGDALASADAGAGTPTWSATAIDSTDALRSASCSAAGLCVALGAHNDALASDDPSAPLPAWSGSLATEGVEFKALSCLAGGACVAFDGAGQALTARVPAPAVETSAATALSASAGTLNGSVNPEDATPLSCSFQYGTSTAYGQIAPCAGTPSPAAGAQTVSATLGGLAPNTTYHYRLLAASPAGGSTGADASFTTATSSAVALIYPHPSISGTAALDEKLTCQSGVAAGAETRLGFQWLRNQIAIGDETASTYMVRGADNGAHLQCQVTSTDGGGSATATSAFANVPVESPPTASGETSVGRAGSLGERITVPVSCAADAPAGCRIVLRASASETLRAGRVVAIAARAPRGARTAAASHVTVTLALATARLGAGQSRTVALSLDASGRRLLAARRKLAVLLGVSGTVIGVIEAKLAQQTLKLTPAPTRAKKAARTLLRATPIQQRDAALATAHASLAAARPASPLSPTPYMGWDTYFAFGAHYDESTILMQASQLISLGLERRGYDYVWLDVGWWQGARAPDGQITVNRAQWPHGLRWLTSTLHAAGLRVGLYTDAGPDGCGGVGEGSYGHYQQDVNTFAAWGFDAVKVDFCGGAELHLDPVQAYTSFHDAIEHNSSHRPMLLNICDFLQPDQYSEEQPTLAESAFASYTFGPAVANSWRTDTDVGGPGDVSFADVLRNIDADAAAPQAAGPGHWNDPDYLGPDQGLSAAQFRTQFSMWSMLAAPLMISDNLDTISAASRASVSNAAVIAVDQDPAGIQGTLLSSSGDAQVWVKPLAGGARAVALLNRGGRPLVISTSVAALNMRAGAPPYRLRNLWTGALSSTRGVISASVPAQSTVLLRVSAG